MDEKLAARHRRIVARLTMALGAFGVLRTIPELVTVLFWLKGSIDRGYAGFLVLDVALAIDALAWGWTLRRSSSWGWAAATFAWASVAANSALACLVILPHELRRSASQETLVLLPRILFYVVSLVMVPYVFWAASAAPRSGIRSKLFVAAAAALLGLLVWWTTAFLLEVDPITLQRSRRGQAW